MKLYLISQDQNNEYETFDSAVVAAPDKKTARNMNPNTGNPMKNWNSPYSTWCNGKKKVTVRYLGEAVDDVEKGVVCASFNAG